MQLVVDKYMLENDMNVEDFKMHFYECPVTGHLCPYVFFGECAREKLTTKIMFLF